MAIRSAYVINEEQDGFVAVDFGIINGYDEHDRHDLTAWEFVDQVDADVSDSVESAGSDAETIVGEDVESLPEYSDGEDDECGRSDDISESVDFAGSLVPDVLEECLSWFGEDAKSVTESNISPEYSDETIAGEDEKSVPNSSTSPEYMTETIADYSYNINRSGHEKYSYEEEDVEEDDYDLDDELVPYYVNGKLGRERMRKLGKRSCTKSIKSKRLTYNYNKAGCLRGKHGLGLKHSLM